MQRRKNIYLAISLCFFVVVTLVVFMMGNRETATIDKNIFRKADLTKTDRIVINNNSSTLEISFDGRRWMVNGFPADRNMVEVLFATLEQAEPKRAVASSLADSLNKVMEENGIKVDLFAGSELASSFLVTGTPNKSQTYFKSKGGSAPYVMAIPGYRVYIAGIFELDESGWRDKLVFNFNWRNFKNLTVKFHDEPDDDFEVGIGQEKYFTILNESAVDTTKLNDFLDAVSYLTLDRFATEEYVRSNNPSGQAPIVTIKIEDVSGKEYTLDFFDRKKDQSYHVGVIQDSTLVLFEPRKIQQLVKPKSWFLTEQ